MRRFQHRYLVLAALLCFAPHSFSDPVDQPLLLGYVNETCDSVMLEGRPAVAPPGFKVSPQVVVASYRGFPRCAAIPVYAFGSLYYVLPPGEVPRFRGESQVIINWRLAVDGLTGTSLGIRGH